MNYKIIGIKYEEENTIITLEFENTYIKRDSYFVMDYQGNDQYFKVKKILSFPFGDKITSHVDIEEVGYYSDKLYNYDVDYLKLFNSKFELITDKEVIKKIEQESRYC